MFLENCDIPELAGITGVKLKESGYPQVPVLPLPTAKGRKEKRHKMLTSRQIYISVLLQTALNMSTQAHRKYIRKLIL
jgi:hypothetical protein